MRFSNLIFLVSLCFFHNFATAATPTCTSSSGGFCSYSGKVKSLYVNAGNQILLYFDVPASLSALADSGYDAVSTMTRPEAGIVRITTNPEFAKLFYSTALAAQASGRDVSLQMRETYNGYLIIDRIWLQAP